MHFSSRTDLEAPIDYVFEALSDFDGFEKAALRRGAQVARIDRMDSLGPGMKWRVQFEMRDKPRRLDVTLGTYEKPSLMRFDGESRHMNGDLQLDLMELSRRHTRVAVRLEIKPVTLTARIMLQSMRLGKARLTARFQARIAMMSADIEDRFKRGQSARV